MIINIDSIEKIRKIVIEFDSDDQEIDSQNNQNTKDIKTKSNRSFGSTESNKVHVKQEYQPQDGAEYIDLSESKEQAQVSQEIVEKPVIPDRKRETKVSSTMQNLSI
nr:MAG TPA: hypothetical protein [Caudoviricetes sp.]